MRTETFIKYGKVNYIFILTLCFNTFHDETATIIKHKDLLYVFNEYVKLKDLTFFSLTLFAPEYAIECICVGGCV